MKLDSLVFLICYLCVVSLIPVSLLLIMAPGSQNSRSKDKSEKADKSDKADKPILSVIKDLKASATAVLQHYEYFDTVENLQRQVKELNQQLKEANAKVEKAQEEQKQNDITKEELTKSFEQRIVKWKEREHELEAQLKEERTKAELSSQKKERRWEEHLENYEKNLRKLEEDLECERDKNTNLNSRLRWTEKTLSGLRGDFHIVPLEQDFFSKSFKNLEDKLFDLTERFFKGPLQPFDQGHHHFPRTSQPILFYADYQTVPCARIAQSLIADRLSKDVFKPMCIASPKGLKSMGDEIQRSRNEPRQKAILRSLLFKTFHAEEEEQQRDIINSVTSELLNQLEAMLSPEGNSVFKEELSTYLKLAAQLWNQIKSGSDWVLASSDWHNKFREWKKIRGQSSSTVVEQQRLQSGVPWYVMFPQMYVDGNDSLLHPGSLWSFDKAPVEEKRNAQSPRARRVSASRSSKSPTVAEASSDSGVTPYRSLPSRDKVAEMGRRVSSDSEGQRRCKSTC
ncbi:hypothetical protein BO83DRAFT_312755 [Aspergillus eucalypticola CBS 122712]|uniref:Uncharacterized protein n=1 Tax=Aspergillus eucalypticola (strain CBS 122712 / IBT 29274) TaxID=1448314 RepID=A0A317VKJ8_ASPEC|nr:uncharacterized protein BO83DRAFT_312755 [Aspergillus eucalypticola CBS 122712]PWY73458.1 hypothetical protein BO83DRAFT_312755 [Aspergillus eucalypticola CBS 122712]